MKKCNFTLVELLVVVGIIAILAGLIIPATAMARTSAKRAACISNQGQVMKIMRTYLNDQDNHFPINSGSHSYWGTALFHMNRLQELTVARCPSIITTQAKALTAAEDDNALKETYGMVKSSAGLDFRGTKCLKFGTGNNAYQVAPNQLALGGCSAYLDSSSDQIIASAIMNFASSVNKEGRPAMVHGDQSNLFFLDGHAESFTYDTLTEKRYYPTTSGAAKITAWFNPDDDTKSKP